MKQSTPIATAAIVAFLLFTLVVGGCKAKEGTSQDVDALPEETTVEPTGTGLGEDGGEINIDHVFGEEDVTPPTVPS